MTTSILITESNGAWGNGMLENHMKVSEAATSEDTARARTISRLMRNVVNFGERRNIPIAL
jgi:hypothetical protein